MDDRSAVMSSQKYDWWEEAASRVPPDTPGDSAGERVWNATCAAVGVPCGDTWKMLVASSPSENIWHSLHNCVAYQMGAWQKMLELRYAAPVSQPAFFLLGLMLRHTPLPVTRQLLDQLVQGHDEADYVKLYVLELLTYDESLEETEPDGYFGQEYTVEVRAAPMLDIKLFLDCELKIVSAPLDQYNAHTELVRAEYGNLSQRAYVQLRIKVLDQLCIIPRLYRTAEYWPYDRPAQINVMREIADLKEQLKTDEAEAS